MAYRRRKGRRTTRSKRRMKRRSVSSYFSRRKNFKSARSYRRAFNKQGNIGRGGFRYTYGVTGKLSSCGKDYLSVLFNPFSPRLAGLPCIPDWHQAPSQKFFLRRRNVMLPFAASTVASNTDLAYIALNPYTIAGSVKTVNVHTNEAILITNGTGATVATTLDDALVVAIGGAGVPAVGAISVAAAGVSTHYWDSNFAEDFCSAASGNRIRVVGAGIKANYDGKWDDCRGRYMAWKSAVNDRTAISTGKPTFNALLTEDSAAFGALSHNSELCCTYFPIDADDFEYQAATDRGYMMALVFQFPHTQNVAGVQDPTDPSWITECIGWYELCGPGAVGSTGGQANPNDMAKILSRGGKQNPEVSPAMNAANAYQSIPGNFHGPFQDIPHWPNDAWDYAFQVGRHVGAKMLDEFQDVFVDLAEEPLRMDDLIRYIVR